MLGTVGAALTKVKGTFGIAVIAQDEPDRVIAARRGSPIVIGVGKEESVIASDAAAVVSVTQQVIYLDDNDIAVVTPDLSVGQAMSMITEFRFRHLPVVENGKLFTYFYRTAQTTKVSQYVFKQKLAC